jgi:hypothetical protein
VAQPLLAAVRVCQPGGLDALRGQTAGLHFHMHSVPFPFPGPARPFHLVSFSPYHYPCGAILFCRARCG